MQQHQFQKQYLAILEGRLENQVGTIDLPIARKSESIIERQVDPSGIRAITHYEVLESFEDATLVSFRLETGRTHQLRVHSSSTGHPILGDTLYGNSSSFIDRQALHACKVSFIHPIHQSTITIEAPIPEDISYVLQQKRQV